MKNILIVDSRVPAFDVSAGEHRKHLFHILLSARHRVFAYPIRGIGERGTYARLLRRSGITVLSPLAAGNGAGFSSLLKRLHIDVVLFEFYDTALPLIFFVPPGIPTVIDSHHINFRKLQRAALLKRDPLIREYSRQSKNRELMVYRLCDKVIAVSKSERKILLSLLGKNKITTVPMCVDYIPPYTISPGRKDIVFFGYYYSSPNTDAAHYFMDAIFPLVRMKLKNAVMHFGGYGLRQRVHLKEKKNVVLDGLVQDIPGYLSRFKVFACPLRYGAGVKKKVLDAMSSGLPVVTTSIGAEGLPFKNGRDICVCDTPEKFAESIVRLCTDEDFWNTISRNGYAAVKRHNGIAEVKKKLFPLFEK